MSKTTRLVLVLLFLIGGGMRFLDLTEPPVDFHPTRQLRDAIIARALYYRWQPHPDPEKARLAEETARQVANFEPPLLEALTAATYLIVGGEHVWFGRVYAILAWLLGTWGSFLLARQLAGEVGAVATTAFALFLPFAFQASRSFQPDPLMSALIVWTAYAAYKWAQTPSSWRRTWAAGLLAGTAIVVKAFAIYPVAGIMAGALFATGWKTAFKRLQTWFIAALSLAAIGLYIALRGEATAGNYIAYWVFGFQRLWYQPIFYAKWIYHFLEWFTPIGALFALAGLYFASKTGKAILLGWLGGYVLLGFTVPYLITTHNYYSLPMTFWVSVALAPTVATIWAWAHTIGRPAIIAVALTGIVLLAAGIDANARFIRASYWGETAHWKAVADAIPADGNVIGLTPTYGMRVRYFGWRPIGVWPPPGEYHAAQIQGREVSDIWEDFQQRTAHYRYFLVAADQAFEAEPQLKEILTTYYPVIASGEGYQVYDLAHPIRPLPSSGK